MPSLGSGLSLGTLNKISGFDYDASAYFQTAGVTDAVTRAKINAFVVGVKNLGIWSSFICWPLKSSQNAGSGTTAYSLGGFGPYNGSFVSSPTWGVDGVTFNGSNSIGISTAVGTSRVNRLAFGVGKISGYTANRLFDIQDGNSNTRRNPFLGVGSFGSFDTIFTLPNSGVTSYEPISNISNLPQNTYYSVIGRTTGSSMFVYRDKVQKGTLTGATFSQGSPYNSASIGGAYTGTIAFVALAGADLSESAAFALNDLYYSTLGNNRDADADSYILRAGVTDTTAQTQINDFVTGVKSLGIWNNMVCWPLRSSQNAGTGTTAYSLGGLATANGTLTNGPTWGTDGVNFVTASNTRIITPAVPFSNSISVFNVFLHTAFGASSGDYSATLGVDQSYQTKGVEDFITGSSGSRALNVWIYRAGGLATDLNVSIPNDSAFLNTFHAFGASASSTNNATLYDGTAVTRTQSTPVVASSQVGIGAQGAAGGRVMTGKIPFTLLSSTGFTASQFSSLYTLYKTTLGTGLGLP